MSQIGSQTTAQNLDFWVRDDALFVIDLLFELRLEKGPDYSIYTPEAFADIRIKLISQHPKCHRLHKYIEGRFQELKTLWAIFEDAIKLPGTTWGNYTGMLAMSPGNQDIVIERHGLYGHRVVFYGLPVGQGVTIETWGAIFRPSGVPLGRHIGEATGAAGFPLGRQTTGAAGFPLGRKTTDAVGFAQAEAQAQMRPLAGLARARARAPGNMQTLTELGETIQSMKGALDSANTNIARVRTRARITRARMTRARMERRGNPINGVTMESLSEETNGLPTFQSPVDGRREQQPSEQQTSLGIPSSSSNSGVAGILGTEEEASLGADVLSERRALQPSGYITQSQVEEVDFKKAVRTCFSLSEERDMAFLKRVIDWLCQDRQHVLIWNELPSDKVRDQWLATNF